MRLRPQTDQGPVLRAGPAPTIRGVVDGALCKDCPFSKDGLPNRPVTGEGSSQPIWIIVGEGPGQNEVALGRPFIGASGQLVNKALDAIGVDRRRLWVTNATLCLPTPDATDGEKNQARKCCEPRFTVEMANRPTVPVLALGAVATQALLGRNVSIQEMAGSYHQVNTDGSGFRAVIPTIHPAAILRGGAGIGGAHSPDIAFWNLMYDAAKVKSIAEGKDIVFREDDIVVEYTDPKRAEQLMRAMMKEARRARMVACDTETYVDDEQRHSALQPINAKLSAIGFATPNWGLSLAWNVVTPTCKRLMAALMADPGVRLVMHNRIYDRGVLRRYGMPVYGPCDDTLLKHHCAFPGLSHNLQRVGTQYFAITPWKSEFRQGKDTIENLCRYCLSAGTPIVLADGTTAVIEDIVRQRRADRVLSQAPDGGIREGRIVDWHKNRVPGQQWVQIQTTANHAGDRGLIVTPDHKVYTQRGPVPAVEVTTDDRVALPEVAFTDVQRAAVLGTLLGDSTLAVSPSYRDAPWNAPGFALQGGHSSATGLSQHKVDYLQPHAELTTEQDATEIVVKGNAANRAAFQPFYTRSLCQLTELARLVYGADWHRHLRVDTLRQLGPVGLAWWFMDDGFHQKTDRGRDRVGIATNGFADSEVEAAVEWFRATYGPTSAGEDCVLRLGAVAAHNFCEEIAEHIIPALRYKLVEQLRHVVHRALPYYDSRQPYYAPVTKSDPYEPPRETRTQRLRAETRFCITVEEDHNFFTSFGLVANCAKDTLVTARLDEPLDIAMTRTKSHRCYEIDLLCAEAAEWMYDSGIPVSREVNQQLYDQFWANMQKARAEIEEKANDPAMREKLLDRVALEQAKRVRKGSTVKQDPEHFEARQQVRLDEIRIEAEKGAWKWKINSTAHLAGWLKIHGLTPPLTKKGAASITKTWLKAHVDKHPAIKALHEWRSNKENAALRKIVEDDANRPEIQDELWVAIAFEQAKTIRTPTGKPPDPEDFEERQKIRLKELLDAAEKGQWEWNVGSSDHIAAYLKARGVPLYFQTEKGATSTKKEILESFAHISEVRALLDYRENQKMFSTFVYSFFDRFDEEGKIVKYGHADQEDRLHPRWNVHRITGRWSAEDPMCFDGETEILTRRGWIRFDALPRDVEVAQYWREDGRIDFTVPTQYIDRQHDGEMTRIKRRHIDLFVTPDHRLLARARRGEWQDIPAAEIKPDYLIPVAGQYAGEDRGVSDAFIALLCAAQADGTWNGSGWDFQFTKVRKIERLRSTLDAAGISYRLVERVVANPFKPGTLRDRTRIYVHQCEMGNAVADLLGAEKTFGPWLLSWTRTSLERFCNEVMFWDGSWTRQNSYSSSNKTCADWVQIVYALTGRRARLRPYTASKVQRQINWQVDVCDRSETYTTHADVVTAPWSGRVYCVSVPSSYIVVRRGPSVMITGQCQNWPKADKKKGRPNLRSQVVAPDGRILVGFDFAQLEARIIALLSGDPFLCDIFTSGKDIHSEFARIVWPNYDDLPYERRKVLRDTVKRPEYGAFYGGSIETLWKNVVKDYPDVKQADIARMVMLMTARMPGVTIWHQKLLRDVAQPPHELRSAIYGRRRCFPLGNADMNDAYNFPVQATGADIMATGLIRLMPKLRDDYINANPIIQIHDAIVFECNEADGERLMADVKECFEQTHTHNGVTVHFPVDPACGRSWADV